MPDIGKQLYAHVNALSGDTLKDVLSRWACSSNISIASLEQALAEEQAAMRAHDAIIESPEFLEVFPSKTEEEIGAENERRWQKFKRTGRGAVSHADAVAWFQSLSTDNPLPCPK